jgi:hypothetical protein
MGISGCKSVLLLVVVVAWDTVLVTVLELALVLVAVLEFGELPHAATTKPRAIAAEAEK